MIRRGPCLCHKWARRVDEQWHIMYACTECPAVVDWTEARRIHECIAGVTEENVTSTLLADIAFDRSSAARELASSLWGQFLADRKGDKYLPVYFMVGANTSTGDSLGPFVGWFLKRRGFTGEYLGDLSQPVHAGNIKDKMNEAWVRAVKHNKFPYIIAVDAAVGRPGRITVNRGPLKPGAGMDKALPQVGSVHVMGGTSHFPFMIWFTGLDQTVAMAEVIADGIALFHQQWETSRFSATAERSW